jgi:hypothetical protein
MPTSRKKKGERAKPKQKAKTMKRTIPALERLARNHTSKSRSIIYLALE